MDIKTRLSEHFQSASSAPFLFIGSGFSRRYLGLEDWYGLLQRFGSNLPNPFGYYFTTADGNLPTVAKLMALDFHDFWWKSEAYEGSRKKHSSAGKDKTSALRIEICEYLKSISNAAPNPEYAAEIEMLSKLNVDGIITTNWDLLLEGLFPDFKVFVGQSELLFSNPQSIAEIYKIHGSATRPSSLILTNDDYSNFEKLNPYLAAKLITLFVEHPIVFMGYSLSDENITGMLRAIVNVLGPENLEKLQNNLIFIKRGDGLAPSYAKTVMAIDGAQLPITVVATDDFLPVYEALDTVKRKIPARVLRHCKEQLYELVKLSEPGEKLVVVDVDEIDSKDDVEFVIGVGVAAAERAGRIGYQGVGFSELYQDLLLDNSKFDPELILTKTVPNLGRQSKYLPVFKYLRAIGIDSPEKLRESKLELFKHIPSDAGFYQGGVQYNKAFIRAAQGMSAEAIVENFPPEKAVAYLPFVPNSDPAVVLNFLRKHADRLHSGSNNGTSYRKLACLYDFNVNGWGMNTLHK
jgi:hypothetical protein